jgi:hypothetical protein
MSENILEEKKVNNATFFSSGSRLAGTVVKNTFFRCTKRNTLGKRAKNKNIFWVSVTRK